MNDDSKDYWSGKLGTTVREGANQSAVQRGRRARAEEERLAEEAKATKNAARVADIASRTKPSSIHYNLDLTIVAFIVGFAGGAGWASYKLLQSEDFVWEDAVVLFLGIVGLVTGLIATFVISYPLASLLIGMTLAFGYFGVLGKGL